MGKTSILKNLSKYLGDRIRVAYIDLTTLGAVSVDEGEGEVLMALSDTISSALSIPPPEDEELLARPSVTFRRFLQAISSQYSAGEGLIIALDEYEKLAELITAGALRSDFPRLLESIIKAEPRIAFAFAGLHTLEEVAEGNFGSLSASVLPVRVGFLSHDETQELLTHPEEGFALSYSPDTLSEVYRLTAGQPYLIQLIGFQLVHRYNQQVSEERQPRDSIFTLEDLNAVVHHTSCFTQGRYYFTMIWGQAAEGPEGQQEVLDALAAEQQGLSKSDLSRKTNLSMDQVDQALVSLERHNVISSSESRWKITVPLLRQWIQGQQ